MNPSPVCNPRLARLLGTPQQLRVMNRLDLQSRTRGLLGHHPIPTCEYFWYHTFAAQVNRLFRHMTKLAELKVEITRLMVLWRSRGMRPEIMRDILKVMFQYPADELVLPDATQVQRAVSIVPPPSSVSSE